ncbi:MAG TPA: GreA/GreB family elongation factor [Terriglobales bacterium]|nr:GreA/GreB family elongation factor [Terriglobales bacterium]
METHSAIISDEDAAKLSDLLKGLKQSPLPDEFQVKLLEDAIDNAKIVATGSISWDIVTVYSAVRIMDLQTGKKKRYTLVWPELADLAKCLLSVSTPLGIALLGHKLGETVEAKAPGGVRRLRIESIRQHAKPVGNQKPLFTRNRVSPLSLSQPRLHNVS